MQITKNTMIRGQNEIEFIAKILQQSDNLILIRFHALHNYIKSFKISNYVKSFFSIVLNGLTMRIVFFNIHASFQLFASFNNCLNTSNLDHTTIPQKYNYIGCSLII